MTEEVTEKTIGSENTTNAAPKSGSGLWIGIIILLIVVLVAGAGFYLYQQLRAQGDDISKEDQRNIEMEKQVSGFQSQLAAMQSQLTAATGTISNADERFDTKMSERAKAQEEKIEATRKELTGAVLQIQRQLGKTRGDWLIADAEYLLSVAGQRLHLMGDVETTREALEAADQRLRESGDAATFKVREQIAKELASLRAIPPIDLVGMYSKLQSLSERVKQLSLFLPYQGKPIAKSSEHDKHNAPSETSSTFLNAALKQFDGYVTVRHTAQPIKAILTAEEAQFIRQQLSLKLEMVKLALVQKNQTLYHASLTDALDWLDKNFNKNAETQGFIAELKQLDTVKLNAQMPDISMSLKMLRDITKLRIETDKGLPAVDLESKLERLKPVVEEPKPVTVETPVANPVANPEKTEKPAITPAPKEASQSADKAATVASPAKPAEVKKLPDTTTATESQPVSKPAAEEKKVTETNKTVSQPATSTPESKKTAETTVTSEKKTPKSDVGTKSLETSSPSALTTEDKKVTDTKKSTSSATKVETNKAPETAVTSEKNTAKSETGAKSPEKSPPPAVIKPVVVH